MLETIVTLLVFAVIVASLALPFIVLEMVIDERAERKHQEMYRRNKIANSR